MAEEKKVNDPVAIWDATLERFINFDPVDVERALTHEPNRYFREKPKAAPK